ncbi:hypothetical protein EIP91_012433 [Steccherinum ochraceum]|uniref:Glutaminase A n=1 Tax=Steccherinum ochraceum TaxID=92696 RepID=A0A4R0RUH7_9APHY|nr:hypothetical protein EIP91_012433 [Steccherinum ochraceum]
MDPYSLRFTHNLLLFLYLIALLSTCVASQSFANPAWAPLAVRSPYLSCWNNASSPLSAVPSFWNQAGATLGWTGMIRVDGVAYQWMGGNTLGFRNPTVLGLEITPTRTIYRFQAGSTMQINVTYLTPIETEDMVKQSIPFSYFYLDAVSADGQPHEVQAYVDITGEWVSGDRGANISWTTTTTGISTFHEISLSEPAQYQEVADQAQDATVYLATLSGTGSSAVPAVNYLVPSRMDFNNSGVVTNANLGNSGPMNGSSTNPWPVFSVSADLGRIVQTPQDQPLVWAIGVVRNPSISYTTATGAVQDRAPYFLVKYPNIESVIDAFLGDFSNSTNRAIALDAQILADAAKISPTYSTLVSTAVRQTIAGIEVTVSKGSDGQWNTSDVKMFMKDVGTSGRVNPVEILYASFPFFLYINPAYAALLLEPLLEYQSSPQYTQPYAATDLGTSYPKAHGNNGAHSQGIEQSANMLIMVLAHALVSGDGTLISRYYTTLRTWTSYLIPTISNPGQQFTADPQLVTNSPNLLLKGIIGVQAMAKIGSLLVRDDDTSAFTNYSQSLMQMWKSSAISSDGTHILETYGGNQSSWSLPYNLYADKLLQTNLVDNALYSAETSFLNKLSNVTTSSATPFGVPVDPSNTQGNAAWTLMTAAIVTDPGVRDDLVRPVQQQIASKIAGFPYSRVYYVDSGDVVSGRASPALGAFFAPLALSLPFKSVTIPPTPPAASTASTTKKSIVGPAVGGVLGGLALLILAAAFWWYWRRRNSPGDRGHSDATVSAIFKASRSNAGAVEATDLHTIHFHQNNEYK